MAYIDLPLESCVIVTTFHCCGSDLTVNLDYETACHHLRCPTCGDYLDGKQKGSLTIFGGDQN